VLLVDNDEDSREMYSVGLSVMGFRPFAAADAEDGFACACDVHPDVIVADVGLPGVSGLELARRLRGDARTNDAGIIMLTGHANDSAQQQADAAGCDRFLIKPCLPAALALAIHDVLITRRPAFDTLCTKSVPSVT
jgi:DNA-binding response OmpR family regulator